ncbi:MULTISPECIES: hypothetical protein [Catenuloplanes]|uniref:Uncharacterized protein n=1 Tax=Catenuloplanes niger TaxID=587534 RepID=A0AAE3ZVI0_9ACTN|nr:hypothetical protein [Catenuloplanes niger]MDR7325490.1 hypothetical protein [Catenuloplanes niger]
MRDNEKVRFDPTAPDIRPVGWQVQMRIDWVVTQVMATHRGLPEDQVRIELAQRLRGMGATAGQRQVDNYARAISALPSLPATGTATDTAGR